jgi:hypothetical protein
MTNHKYSKKKQTPAKQLWKLNFGSAKLAGKKEA